MKRDFNADAYKARLQKAQVYARRHRDQAVALYPWVGKVLRALWSLPAKIVYGLIITGLITLYLQHKREETRALLMHTDVDRVSNLQQLSLYIVDYYRSYHKLPDTLKDVESGANPAFIRDDYLYDPETNQLYTYKLTSKYTYQLCANFHYSTEDLYKYLLYTTSYSATWDHHPGNNCFELSVTPYERPMWLQQ